MRRSQVKVVGWNRTSRNKRRLHSVFFQKLIFTSLGSTGLYLALEMFRSFARPFWLCLFFVLQNPATVLAVAQGCWIILLLWSGRNILRVTVNKHVINCVLKRLPLVVSDVVWQERRELLQCVFLPVRSCVMESQHWYEVVWDRGFQHHLTRTDRGTHKSPPLGKSSPVLLFHLATECWTPCTSGCRIFHLWLCLSLSLYPSHMVGNLEGWGWFFARGLVPWRGD